MPFIGNKPTAIPLSGDDLEDNIISTAKIQDNAVTPAKYIEPVPFRNIIINGDMSINQRNATINNGNSTNTYAIDRFHMFGAVADKMSGQQSTTAPTYFKNSFLTTSLAATTPAANDAYGVRQIIEGSNIVNLSWGSASAKTVTLSFWVRSSITGTYALALFNGSNTRSYVETYTINSADTFEYKTITIDGDTAGTWLTTNGRGIDLWWDLGSGSDFNTTAGSWGGGLDVRTSGSSNWIGTSGATFYITGVQLEVGTTASDFEFLPFDVNLARCQRYYWQSGLSTANHGAGFAISTGGSTYVRAQVSLPVTMRSVPSVSFTGVKLYNSVVNVNATSINGNFSSNQLISVDGSSSASTGTSNGILLVYIESGAGNKITASSEL